MKAEYEEVLSFALSLPDTTLSDSFRESAVRIASTGKIPLFARPPERGNQFSLRLRGSQPLALSMTSVALMGHGYGKHGWGTIRLDEIACDAIPSSASLQKHMN